jgi:hypothetical protein
MHNFRTLGQPLLGEKYVTQKEERKKFPKIVDTMFRCNTKGQRTHFALTNYVLAWLWLHVCNTKDSAHKELSIVSIMLSLMCDGVCVVYKKVPENKKTTTNIKNAATENIVCTKTLLMYYFSGATKD